MEQNNANQTNRPSFSSQPADTPSTTPTATRVGTRAYLEDVLYGGEDEVLSSQSVHHILVSYGLGRNTCLADELRAAPDEGHELVVVQTPDALAASRLHPVALLQLLYQSQVAAAARQE